MDILLYALETDPRARGFEGPVPFAPERQAA